MRIALSLLLVGLTAAIVSSQEDELVPAPYLAPQYTASSDAPASVVIAGSNEPGERLIVTGRVLDGAELIAGASIFVFQTDAAGRYAPDKRATTRNSIRGCEDCYERTGKDGIGTRRSGPAATTATRHTFTTW